MSEEGGARQTGGMADALHLTAAITHEGEWYVADHPEWVESIW